jgi:uncharacterized protein YecE (DUF72 family)
MCSRSQRRVPVPPAPFPGVVADVRVGCSSWTSEAWTGKLYPSGLPPGQRLAVYARYYDCVEVDATYYAIPARAMVRGWAQRTPDAFRFGVKLSKDLLGRGQPIDEGKAAAFLAAIAELGGKLSGVVAQFPPSFRPPRSGDGGAADQLARLVERFAPEVPLAVELRDAGWYVGERGTWLERLLRENRTSLAWSALTFLEVPPILTSDRIYLRFIGDHTTIPEDRLGVVRVDRSRELAKWASSVRERLEDVETALAFFNNHFAGYAPASANAFLELLGRPVPALPELGPTVHQRSLEY